MPENQTFTTVSPAEEEINLLDLLIVLAKHKKMILGITLFAALLAVVISMRMPNIYTATSKILPPQSNNQSNAVSAIMQSQLGSLSGAAGSLFGLKDPNALYISLMKSRTITEKIARRFDLQKAYGEETMTATINMLGKNSVLVSGKDGIIKVEVNDVDPKRAAALANAYFEELEQLTQTMAISEVSQRRLFFEKQLKSAKDRLTDFELFLDKTPATSLKYMDAMRNFKYQEVLYATLIKQYEVAKLDEAKEGHLIQILEKALEPEIKSGPNRKNIVILATLGAAFLSIVLAVFLEARSRLKGDPGYERRRALFWSYLK